MTDTSTTVSPIARGPSGASYVEWSAIFAGALIASAIIVLMTAFGSAIGLSLVSPYQGPSPAMFYVALALWSTWITVSSFVAGGYVTGRLRRPIDGATPHEVHVRDGAHGLLTWAATVVIGVSLATFSLSSAVTTMSLSSAIKGSADRAQPGAPAASSRFAPSADPMGYETDVLLRNDGAPAVGGAEFSRQEVARILMKGAVNGSLNDHDSAYLARVVSARDGLKLADAEKRVDAMSEHIKTSAEKERRATQT